MASDFGTPQSLAIKDKSCVISKGWCVRGIVTWIYQLIPPDMVMIGGSAVFGHLYSLIVSLDLMSEIYIRC